MAGRNHPALGLAVAIAAMLLLPLTSGWVFYADDRKPSSLPMIGILEVDLPEGTSRGTAVAVDRCGIITNFHVVFGPWLVTALRPPSRAFQGTFTLTSVTLADGSHPSARATPVAWGEYLGADRHFRRAQEDWAYLVLDDCLPYSYGYFNIRSIEPEDLELRGDKFAAIGYSAGRQMIDPSCSIRAVGTATSDAPWLHDCALLIGDSGGPIVQRGTTTVVALGEGMTNGFGSDECPPVDPGSGATPMSRWDAECANLAVPLTWPIIERIRAAEIASGTQRSLIRLGYDAGPMGAVNDPRVTSAISAAQHEMGLTVTGEPSCGLWILLAMRTGDFS